MKALVLPMFHVIDSTLGSCQPVGVFWVFKTLKLLFGESGKKHI